MDTLAVARDSVKGLGIEVETELGSEPDSPHHTQRIVGKRDVGIEGRADKASL